MNMMIARTNNIQIVTYDCFKGVERWLLKQYNSMSTWEINISKNNDNLWGNCIRYGQWIDLESDEVQAYLEWIKKQVK